MKMEKRIEKLKQARELVAEVLEGCGIPQLESMLYEADMNLHWALWNLGEVVELRQECEQLAAK